MIPLKLHLKNFLSYGSPTLQTIEFSNYPLICLSGKNGHGKSALLDAITWALWGQARKTSATVKADQGLVHLGQTQMMVIFDFEFNHQLYRVKREFAITYGKPLATLEFGLLDAEKNSIIPLTGKTIRDTQAVIEIHSIFILKHSATLHFYARDRQMSSLRNLPKNGKKFWHPFSGSINMMRLRN